MWVGGKRAWWHHPNQFICKFKIGKGKHKHICGCAKPEPDLGDIK